jgi:ABC-type uncharacterized transport system permease subunit
VATLAERFNVGAGVASRRAVIYGIVFILIGLAIFALFALPTATGLISTFTLTATGQTTAIPVGNLVIPSSLALYVAALVCVFAGGWQLARGFARMNLALGLIAGLFVAAFLIWAARDASLNLTGLLSSSLLRAVPIALAGLSGVLCERAAVINIAIEGMMLSGAFMAALMTSLAWNVWGWAHLSALIFGLICAILAGALMGLMLAVLAVRFKVDHIIAGTAINILATGVTSFLSARILSQFEQLNNAGTFDRLPIPGLASIPVIGPVFFNQNPLVYLMFILLIVTHVMLFFTRWGLRTRAVGEHPRAADTLGINVYLVRYVNVVMGGMVAGLAGAFLILGSVGRFDEVMTAGKGFIGLAAMIFGKWMPFGAFGAALIFGFADALQTKLSILRVPIASQFLLMAPYIVTIIVLAGVVGEATPPAADGQAYEKQ